MLYKMHIGKRCRELKRDRNKRLSQTVLASITLYLMLWLPGAAMAQVDVSAYEAEWEKTLGGSASEDGRSVQQTSDGGYIIAGFTSSGSNGNFDVYLVKTDAQGDVVWEKNFGGSNLDFGYAVQQTTDGGYIITGKTNSFSSSDDVYLVKTDASGNKVWEKNFGGTGTDVGSSVRQTSDGGYIVAGNTTSSGAGSDDIYLIKTDEAGNVAWENTFGGSSSDLAYAVEPTADGGYIITGRTASFGAGNVDVYMVKTDASGNKVWEKTFGGTNYDDGRSVKETADGGYIVAGYTNSKGAGDYDAYLVKLDASGNLDWEKTFGGSGADCGYSLQITADKSYIIAGSTNSFGAGSNDVYLIKADETGNTIWEKTFGNTANDFAYSVDQTEDGSYIIAGKSGLSSYDVYLICFGIPVSGISFDITSKVVGEGSDPFTITATITPDEATNKDLIWTSSNNDVAVVDNGVVTPLTDGQAIITAQTADGDFSASCTVEIRSANANWEETLGGSDSDAGYAVQQTNDGGYIIAGTTYSYGAGRKDIYLIKTDSFGSTAWEKTFGQSGDDVAYSVQQTSDGGYIIAGVINENINPEVYLIKTNTLGNVEWEKCFGSIDYFEIGYSVQETSDNGFIIVGYHESKYTSASSIYVIKTDALGNWQWDNYFSSGLKYNKGYSVDQCNDGGYIIAGQTGTLDNKDIYLIKVDDCGNRVWEKLFGGIGGNENDYSSGQSVQQTSDGGYIIAGFTYLFSGTAHIYMIKTDAAGNTLWERIFEGITSQYGISVQQLDDGGYIVAGAVASHDTDVYLVRTDAAGHKVWEKSFGGDAFDYGKAVAVTNDGGYIITGYSTSFGSASEVYLIKLAPVHVSGISLDQESLVMKVNDDPITLTATIAPVDASNIGVIWSSSDSSVASVSNGVITPLKLGVTDITAKSADGEYTAACRVQVIPTVTPVDGAVGEPVRRIIRIEFPYEMDQNSLNGSTMYLKQGSNLIPATIRYTPVYNYVSLIPMSPLLYNTVYTAVLTYQVKDAAGNYIGQSASDNLVWHFTTEKQAWPGPADTPWPQYMYDTGHGGNVESIISGNANLRRKLTTGQGCVASAVGDGVMYTATSVSLLALDLQGNSKWSYPVPAVVNTTPALAGDGTVYFTAGSTLYAVKDEINQGATKWTFDLPAGCRPLPALLDDIGNILVATVIKKANSDGSLVYSSSLFSVNSRGQMNWSDIFDHPVYCPPAMDRNGMIYFSAGPMVYAYTSTGQLAWAAVSSDGTHFTSLAVDHNNHLILGTEGGSVTAIDNTGLLLWNQTQGAHPVVSLGTEGKVLVSNSDRNIYIYDSDGNQIRIINTGSVLLAPVISDPAGNMVVGAADGWVYSFRYDGTERWRYKTGGQITAPASIGGDGTVFICSSDGCVYALGGSAVELVPDSARIPVNSETNCIVKVSGVTDLYGIDLGIQFDHNVLEVVSITPGGFFENAVSPILPSDDGSVAGSCYTYNNAQGIIKIAGSKQGSNSFTGSADLAVIKFRGKSKGITALSFDTITMIDKHSAVVNASKQESFLEVTNGSTIMGKISPEGKTVPGDVSIKLKETTTGLVYDVKPLSDWQFVFSEIPAGSYNLTVSSPVYLRERISNISMESGNLTRDIGTILIKTGDTNQDNKVDLLDAVVLANAYAAVAGDSRWNPQADFNKDNGIDIADLTYIGRNLDCTGAADLEAQAQYSVQSTSVNIPYASLSLVIQESVEKGSTFDVPVYINDAADIQGIDFLMTFDPQLLTVVDICDTAAGIQISQGGFFDGLVVRNQADSQNGMIRFVTAKGYEGVNGSGIIATVRFQALDSGEATVRFESARLVNQSLNWSPCSTSDYSVNITAQAIDECFIATAAYGSKFAPAVKLLRQFRDEYLLTNAIGKSFVKFYYLHSPPVAKYIVNHSYLKTVVRIILIPFICLAYIILHPVQLICLILLITAIILTRRSLLRDSKIL